MTNDPQRPSRRRLALFGAILVAAGLAVTGYIAIDSAAIDDSVQARPSPAAFTVAAEQLALGKTVYASQCAVCHGANLEGQPNWRQRKPNGRMPAPPHDETGHTWHHDDETLFNLTKYGLSALIGQPVATDMPAYDGVLSDAQIRAALAYIKAQWPAQIQQRQAEMSRRANAERSQ